MMRRLQDCLSTAFTEADADLRPPAIFRIERTRVDHAGAHRSPMRQRICRLSRCQNHSVIPVRKVSNIFKTHSRTVRLSSTDSIGNAPACISLSPRPLPPERHR